MHVAKRISRIVSLCSVLISVAMAIAADAVADEPLKVGAAETIITPPNGFPIAGYYHERLAEGTIDPLKAKALVFRQGDTAAAMVVCDLTAISHDLCEAVRERAAKRTSIPPQAIAVSATHSHTAPDYGKRLFEYLGNPNTKGSYPEAMIEGIVEAIVDANDKCQPANLSIGSATQETPVAFNRRFVMKDGSVQTWKNFLGDPNVIRSAGPIDPEVLVATFDRAIIKKTTDAKPSNSAAGAQRMAVLSNFALHLDTVGGMRWSADYPYFIEQNVRERFGSGVISIFGTGCCGDINHSDPNRRERNKTDFIGNQLGATVVKAAPSPTDAQPLSSLKLQVQNATVSLPLQEVSDQQWQRSIDLLNLIAQGGKVEFLDQVAAYRTIIVGQLRDKARAAEAQKYISWGLSRSWAGVGASLPVDVQTITFGDQLAIVFLPGEVFVDLGLSIKRHSPFEHTMVIELSNAVETAYIPTQAAHVGGSYEVTNSTTQPGSGEKLVDAALAQLQNAARKNAPSKR